ncbi:MAG: C69 family dipeptidase, partial [Prevotellaceae bacterium]|nr:C69 family dipeptidase [Prevotellaceae bacterium]
SGDTVRVIKEWDTGKILGRIPEAKQTYNVVGNINEHALAIAETTFGGRPELVDTTAIIDYGSLIYIALQRAKNAREAIKVMTELVEKHGYYSAGESFSIADTSEAWILEMVGKGSAEVKNVKGKPFAKGAVWVAVRIPDGYVSGHANQARIQRFPLADGKTSITSKDVSKKIFNKNIEVAYSADVIDFARACGYYGGADKDFSFSDAFNPVDFEGARFCEARVWSFFKDLDTGMNKYLDYAMGYDLKNRIPLYIKPSKKLDVLDVANAMRDHYENTPMDMRADIGAGAHARPYRWRPMTWELDSVKYLHERATATQQTGFWFVSESRGGVPTQMGGILWFGVDDAATSCLAPVYCGSTEVPECFRAGNGDMLTYSPTAAFWTFNRVTNFAYIRYDLMSQDIVKVQKEMEQLHVRDVKRADYTLSMLFNGNSKETAIQYLTAFSKAQAERMHSRWQDLDKFLLIKFIDGNVKKEKKGWFERTKEKQCPMPDQPQLPEKWRRAIVDDNGEVLKIR